MAALFLSATLPSIQGCANGSSALPLSMEKPPLVEQMDRRVGIVYPNRLRTIVATAPAGTVALGAATVGRLRGVYPALFTRPVDLDEWPRWREQPNDLDGVIELNQLDMDATLGTDAMRLLRNHWVRVRLEICLYLPDGQPVTCVASESENTLPECQAGLYGLDRCLNAQADAALRDAIAQFLERFQHDPSVLTWRDRPTTPAGNR